MLKTGRDKLPDIEDAENPASVRHNNLRGAAYYQ
jgi:hypothetical protein